jgi:CMP-N-acetylneuraminic acid synthetase
MMMNVLGIIPARKGSKGIPGKNSKMLDGKPLIAYAFETALQSKTISHIVCNTDCPACAEVAASYGIAVQERDPILATDNAPTYPVVEKSLLQAEANLGITFDAVLLLQPTSPFRHAHQADEIIGMLAEQNAIDGIVSVVSVGDHHPSRMYRIGDQRILESLDPNHEIDNRQNLEKIYVRNGCFYGVRRNAMLEAQTLVVKKKIPYLMDEKWAINIDTENDFLLASVLMTSWKETL